METQELHALLPEADHDDQARQMFIKNLRSHLAASVVPGVAPIYQTKVRPAFEKEHGRAPADRYEVRKAMVGEPYYQFWSAAQRCSQEMMFDSVIDTIEQDFPRLRREVDARARGEGRNPKGSLRLNPGLEIPKYHRACDIHLQPGGYHTEFTGEDFTAGTLYDRALSIYQMGGLGPRNDLLGRIIVNYFKHTYPERKPLKILDMGCAIGNCTVPWAEAFPEAEVHGIDVGAPVLRYAHARAEELGVACHFSQQNAEATDFAGESFDLVTSCIILHETSRTALPNVMKESYRLLKPGGMMLHLDIPRPEEPFVQFLYDWENYNNNEPFSRGYREFDVVGAARDAGFGATARQEDADAGFGSGQRNYSAGSVKFPIFAGEKPA